MPQPTHFCTRCGQPVEDGSTFCPHCGQPQGAVPQQPAPESQPQGTIPDATPARRKRRPSIALILIGLLIFLFGLRIPAAQLLGVTSAGVITEVSQEVSSSSDRMDYNYTVKYIFTAGNSAQSGSYMLMHVYNQGDLPDIGTTLLVHYLPGLAFVNYADGQESISLSTILTLVVGAGIFALGLSGGARMSFRRRW